MSKQLRLTAADLSPFSRTAVGFGRLFEQMDRIDAAADDRYPPYNIRRIHVAGTPRPMATRATLQKYFNDVYEIVIAATGFTKEQITITLEDGVLSVVAETNTEEDEVEYLHRGLALRGFERSFSIADSHLEVTGAEFKNGLLIITLERFVPDEKKPRTIDIV